MNSDSWCVKCAKYLAFGTFERADDSALTNHFIFVFSLSLSQNVQEQHKKK